jgi:hypothetical protein
MVCVCVQISTGIEVFIGVQGGVTDLVKSVTHHVVVAGLAMGQTDKKPSRPATPGAHWSASFTHCLIMSGTSLG